MSQQSASLLLFYDLWRVSSTNFRRWEDITLALQSFIVIYEINTYDSLIFSRLSEQHFWPRQFVLMTRQWRYRSLMKYMVINGTLSSVRDLGHGWPGEVPQPGPYVLQRSPGRHCRLWYHQRGHIWESKSLGEGASKTGLILFNNGVSIFNLSNAVILLFRPVQTSSLPYQETKQILQLTESVLSTKHEDSFW